MESALPARLDRTDPRALLGARLWRGHEQADIRAQATGFAALDRVLPGGGWPLGAVSEILHAQPGAGELSLALPLLATLTQAGRKVAFVAPPCLPYAPCLASAGLRLEHLLVVDTEDAQHALWSAELLLRAGGSVLLWADGVQTSALRRLQLAAESQDACVLLYRSERWAGESTPSALRLRVWRKTGGAPCVEVLKCRGAKPEPLMLAAPAAPIAVPATVPAPSSIPHRYAA